MILPKRHLHILSSYKQPIYKGPILCNKIHKPRLVLNIVDVSNYAKFLKL